MKSLALLAVVVLASPSLVAQPSSDAAGRVARDGSVIDRVAEVAHRDLPSDLLKRMINQDIDLLRGKRGDGTFEYAGYERMEASRSSDSFSVQPKEHDDLVRLEVKGQFTYRLLLDSPSRKLLVTKNRRVYVDHVEVEYIPQGSSVSKVQAVKVETWIDPGTAKSIELDEIARSATARVYARGDKELGYGNLTVTLVQARVFDNPDSPYADAVASAKAIQKALDHDDIPSIRAMATRMESDLVRSTPASSRIDVLPPPLTQRAAEAATPAGSAGTLGSDSFGELQQIEDLLTGSEAEKRQGMDRLHQLLRKNRNR